MNAIIEPVLKSSLLATRLARLVPLDDLELSALQAAENNPRLFRARFEVMREGEPIKQRLALLSGWACRQRIFHDGQRQILIFLMPGDLVGVCQYTHALAATTVVTITEVKACAVPEPQANTALAEALARSAALEERYLMAQITRIGRLDAQQRIVDWLLETSDRLALVGLATRSQFKIPLTQELLADTLGLTSVHVNRMLQTLRRDGLLIAQSGTFTFPDRARLEKLVDYSPARVSSDG